MSEMKLFALGASRGYGERIAAHLGIALSELEEREFEDGEHKSRPLVSVRGDDVFVVQSLYGGPAQNVNDKLCRFLFFLGTLRDNGARSVTAVAPYLAYARKDRTTQPRDPVTTKHVARLFESVGIDRIVTLDVHNLAAFQNAFRCETGHLEGKALFKRAVLERFADSELAVVSPDAGGVKRAEAFRQALEKEAGRDVTLGFMQKYRALGIVRGETLAGDVANRTAIVIDDLISTGTTLMRAVHACREAGAMHIYAAASHGLFTDAADRALADPALAGLVITDTVPPFRLGNKAVLDKLVVLDATALFAEAIRRFHDGGSIVGLLG